MAAYPPEILGVLQSIIDLAGRPDHLRSVLTYMTRQSLQRAWAELALERPLVVGPVATCVPFERSKGYAPAEVADIIQSLRLTVAVNALGLPSVTLPVGESEGLPQVVQIIGPRFREDLCLDAAAAVEARAGAITPIDPRGPWSA